MRQCDTGNSRTGFSEGERELQNINLEHPEYVSRKAMWRKYRDLYVGRRTTERECSPST